MAAIPWYHLGAPVRYLRHPSQDTLLIEPFPLVGLSMGESFLFRQEVRCHRKWAHSGRTQHSLVYSTCHIWYSSHGPLHTIESTCVAMMWTSWIWLRKDTCIFTVKKWNSFYLSTLGISLISCIIICCTEGVQSAALCNGMLETVAPCMPQPHIAS